MDGSFGMGSKSPRCDEALEEEEDDAVEGDGEVGVVGVVEGGLYIGDVPRGVSPRFHA